MAVLKKPLDFKYRLVIGFDYIYLKRRLDSESFEEEEFEDYNYKLKLIKRSQF